MSDRLGIDHPTNLPQPDRNAEIIRRVELGEKPGAVALDMGITKSVVAGVMGRAGVTGDRHKQRAERRHGLEAAAAAARIAPKAVPGKRECCFPLWPHSAHPDHPDFGLFCCAPVARPRRGADGIDQPRSWCPVHLVAVLSREQPRRTFRKTAPGPATANLIS